MQSPITTNKCRRMIQEALGLNHYVALSGVKKYFQCVEIHTNGTKYWEPLGEIV